MHSKRLNQVIRLELERAAFHGPVNKRDIAEQVYRIVRDDGEYWTLADKRDALVNLLVSAVGEQMSLPMSEQYLLDNLPSVPRKYMHLLEKTPTFIPINARLGQHVLAIRATQEDWAAAARIKRAIGERVITHADVANDIRLALATEGAASLEDLAQRQAA
jgi:hypothetical protein